MVNLQGLDAHLKVSTNDHIAYYYYSCDGLKLAIGDLDDQCNNINVAMCQQDTSTSPGTYS